MYFRRKNNSSSILKVEDDYATLKKISVDETYCFDITYHINQNKALHQNATYVDISIYDKSPTNGKTVNDSQTTESNSTVLSNILNSTTIAKTSYEQRKNNLLIKKRSDITKKINNEQTANTKQLRRNSITVVPAGQLNNSNEKKPILRRTISNDEINERSENLEKRSLGKMSKKMLFNEGIDPSNIIYNNDHVIASGDAIGGTKQRSTLRSKSTGLSFVQNKMFSLQHTSDHISRDLFDVNNADYVTSYENIAYDNIEITDEISFKIRRRDSDNVFIVLELFDAKTRLLLESTTKILNVLKHKSILSSTLKPPVISSAKKTDSFDVNVEMQQVCDLSNAIAVYVKELSITLNKAEQYALVGTYDVKKGESVKFVTSQKQNSVVIYRFIPVYHDKLGHSYTNLIIKPKHSTNSSSVVLVASSIDNQKKVGTGVEIEAREIPDSVTSIQFLQRNLSTKQLTYDNISAPQLITDYVRNSDYVSMITTNVIDGDIYEFSVRLIYENGLSKISSAIVYEYVRPSPNKIDVQITNLNIENLSQPNVSFDISLDYVDNSLEEIRSVLERQGIKNYFDNNIEKQREQLKWLLAYSIQRIDMSTGDIDDMGVITTPHFSDKGIGNKRQTKPLVPGGSYRYVIDVVTRSPETLFEKYEKTSVDQTTGKTYTFKPSKFQHPITLKTGTIITPAGLKTRYSKSALAHGTLGTTRTIDVSFNQNTVMINNASAKKFDRSKVVMTWQVHGDNGLIDHYLIVRESHGIKEYIGKVHSQNPTNNIFVNEITDRDIGQYHYIVIPIMNNYSYGNSITTNSVIIGARL